MSEDRSITNDLEGSIPPHKATEEDKEVVYFEGSPLLRGEIGKLSLMVLLGLALLVGGVLLRGVSWYLTAGMAVAGILVILLPVLFIRAIRYRISNYRIDYERGLLSKSIDTLELWHVDDISFRQSLLDRILHVGTITVISSDDSTPNLQMYGLPDPRPLFENLKQRVITVKRQRGVIKMDIG